MVRAASDFRGLGHLSQAHCVLSWRWVGRAKSDQLSVGDRGGVRASDRVCPARRTPFTNGGPCQLRSSSGSSRTSGWRMGTEGITDTSCPVGSTLRSLASLSLHQHHGPTVPSVLLPPADTVSHTPRTTKICHQFLSRSASPTVVLRLRPPTPACSPRAGGQPSHRNSWPFVLCVLTWSLPGLVSVFPPATPSLPVSVSCLPLVWVF